MRVEPFRAALCSNGARANHRDAGRLISRPVVAPQNIQTPLHVRRGKEPV